MQKLRVYIQLLLISIFLILGSNAEATRLRIYNHSGVLRTTITTPAQVPNGSLDYIGHGYFVSGATAGYNIWRLNGKIINRVIGNRTTRKSVGGVTSNGFQFDDKHRLTGVNLYLTYQNTTSSDYYLSHWNRKNREYFNLNLGNLGDRNGLTYNGKSLFVCSDLGLIPAKIGALQYNVNGKSFYSGRLYTMGTICNDVDYFDGFYWTLTGTTVAKVHFDTVTNTAITVDSWTASGSTPEGIAVTDQNVYILSAS